ncbi:hypothetical protein [Vibrio maritimus]|uniref:hypothetical protein n=1 Tax=Vibrio maritimus TaxID=990268 RepID=UPI001F34F753|nr:hypothetical protein [Vibrio maritimus]
MVERVNRAEHENRSLKARIAELESKDAFVGEMPEGLVWSLYIAAKKANEILSDRVADYVEQRDKALDSAERAMAVVDEAQQQRELANSERLRMTAKWSNVCDSNNQLRVKLERVKGEHDAALKAVESALCQSETTKGLLEANIKLETMVNELSGLIKGSTT